MATDPGPREWPAWLRFTLTGLAGLAGGAATVLVSFQDVKHNANDAIEGVHAIEQRVRALESVATTNSAKIASLKESMDEVRSDVKELLRRLPK